MLKESYKNLEEFNLHLDNQREEFFDFLIENIKIGVERNKNLFDVGYIRLTEDNQILDVSFKKEKWAETIDLAKDYYIKIEEYEKCIGLDNLKTQIKC